MILRKFCFIFGLIFSISLSFSSSAFAIPSYTYTGSSTLVDDGNGVYRIKLTSSNGTSVFTPTADMIVDVFLVGGGGGSSNASNGGGSGGGFTLTAKNVVLTAGTNYNVVVGAGGTGGLSTSNSGTASQFAGLTANGGSGNSGSNGGSGGSGGGYGGPYYSAGGYYCCAGPGASNGAGAGGNCASGGSGQGTTTREFGESTGDLYAGGGGGYGGGNSSCGTNWYPGGAGGGGAAGSSGTVNTGGGGGANGSGGSGIVILRDSGITVNQGDTFNFSYTGSFQTFTAPVTAYYQIEAWGAGGSYSLYGSTYSGYGGKSMGIIKLSHGEQLYIYVGSGGTNTKTGGWNGGGNAVTGYSTYSCGGGGGATDIRLVSGDWNDATSLNSRIMVAGGGGGGGAGGTSGRAHGGGLVGQKCTGSWCGYYGTQTAGGASAGGSNTSGYAGGFGYGGSSIYDGYGGGGGGGGWYGGGSGFTGGYNIGCGPGGGGSSYISGLTGCAIHSSNKIFFNASTNAGIQVGNGQAIVTLYSLDVNPPTGGAISYSTTNITRATQTLPITVNDGTDDTAIDTSSRKLLYQTADLTNGSCGNFSDLTAVSYSGSYPDLTVSNFEPNRCYKYSWSIMDTLTNNQIYYSSNIITTSSFIALKDIELGKIININGLSFTKVTSTGLLVALGEFVNDFTQTFSYTGAVQTFTVPYNGWYQIEAWGAQGGRTTSTLGQGGYSSGKIFLNKNDVLYVYIGGQGTANGGTTTSLLIAGGYNGGGGAGNQTGCSVRYWGSGGGATDIRLDSSLNSRIIVAGGGGGCYGGDTGCTLSGATICGTGGNGGTLNGTKGTSTYGYAPGNGATQIDGGAAVTQNGATSIPGVFGTGGGATAANAAKTGGGGGYYGGSGSGHIASSGGGSSFISGYAGVNAITSSSSTTATNTTLHYSGKYFLAGQMQSGVRSGNGQAIITLIRTPPRLDTNLNNVRYLKDCVNGNSTDTTASWVELQAIVNGVNVAKGKTVTGTVAQNASYPYTRIVDGDITTANYAMASANNSQCITIDLGQVYNLDEVGIWHYWGDGRTVYSNTTSASADNSNWVTLISTAESETVNGKRVNAYAKDFFYTGGAQTFTVPQSGWYQIETWGAAGGSAWTSAGGLGYCSGGAGAYSKGKIYLISGETLYVYVGGKGNNATGGSQLVAAGYNGGGAGGNGGSDDSSGSGGGATDVRLASGSWNDTTGLNSRIMVAGGGGGGSCINNSSYTNITYRSGAALINPSISVSAWNQVCAVPEINQKTGYAFGTGRSGWNNTNTDTHGLGGGGGGYYGGNGCRNTATNDYWSGGSGGSSFISGHVGSIAITSVSDQTPKCSTGSDVACATHYSGKVFTDTSMSAGVRPGDGYARITFTE